LNLLVFHLNRTQEADGSIPFSSTTSFGFLFLIRDLKRSSRTAEEAASEQTGFAAEIVHERADAEKPFMGMHTTRLGGVVRKTDAAIAKNYLTDPELRILPRIVNLYIEFAELQALERKPMTMRGGVDKPD
jgi:hypothetical protein